MIMQLKGFPITYVTKGLSRQYYASEAGGRSGMMGIAQMMLGTTAMGYVAMAAKDIAKGREPRDVLDQDTAINFKTLRSCKAVVLVFTVTLSLVNTISTVSPLRKRLLGLHSAVSMMLLGFGQVP